MSQQQFGPSITACRLWEKTSAKGTTYLVGRLGGVRITILPNREREGDGDASHVMLFGQADTTPRQHSTRDEQHSPMSQDSSFHAAPADQSRLPLRRSSGATAAMRARQADRPRQSGPPSPLLVSDPIPF